jgi:two-component system sensor histidine kinase/response regulator
MALSKERVIASITQAKQDLDQALADLEKVPAFDPGRTAFTAHALNNYLQVTSATLELLTPALAHLEDPQIHAWLDGLKQATDLMHAAASHLLGETAQDAKVRLRRVDLALLVSRGCDYYQRRAARKKILLHFQAAYPTADVCADPVAVAAVLDNLLSNAVKYSSPGSTIHVGVHSEPGRVVCAVKDEGPGLSAEDRAKLFRRGVRLSPVPTAGEPSFGYGLAVAKELMDQLKGSIWCESTEGQGARFIFALPEASLKQD